MLFIETNSKSKRYTIQQYKRSFLHHFCNTSSPDDGPKLGWKYLGNNKLWKVYQPIPDEYQKIDTAIRKD